MIERIDRQRFAGLRAGDDIVEVAIGVSGPDLLDDHIFLLGRWFASFGGTAARWNLFNPPGVPRRMNPLVFLFGLALVPPSGADTTAAVTRHLQVELTAPRIVSDRPRSEEHTSELQSLM